MLYFPLLSQTIKQNKTKQNKTKVRKRIQVYSEDEEVVQPKKQPKRLRVSNTESENSDDEEKINIKRNKSARLTYGDSDEERAPTTASIRANFKKQQSLEKSFTDHIKSYERKPREIQSMRITPPKKEDKKDTREKEREKERALEKVKKIKKERKK